MRAFQNVSELHMHQTKKDAMTSRSLAKKEVLPTTQRMEATLLVLLVETQNIFF